MTTICYNKNGKNFLAYYTYKTKAEAQKEAEAINTTKPDKLWNGKNINWTEVNYFFADEQEEMD